MRISRCIQLHEPRGMAHQYWRCHNKEFYLAAKPVKNLYLQCIKESLSPNIIRDNVTIHAFCVMGNHYHSILSYKGSCQWLSNFMRQAHSLFGSRYNKSHNRSGKVAEGRPKTSAIQDCQYARKAHFYVEANPIRAKICDLENLKNYEHCSYGFYAYGIRHKYTELLTPPDWYIALGKTAIERQKKYRRLFKEYLLSVAYRIRGFFEPFIGDSIWKLIKVKQVKTLLKKKTAKKSLIKTEDSS